MTAVLNALSTAITGFDTNPSNIPSTGFLGLGSQTSGEGGVGADIWTIKDQLPVSTAFLGATLNYGRLCRMPANAKIQQVWIGSDVVLDSANPQTLAFDISIAFSDNGAGDGTPYYLNALAPPQTWPATVAGMVAANAATRNKMFGLITLSGNGGTVSPLQPLIDVTPAVGSTPVSLQPPITGISLAAGSVSNSSAVVGVYNMWTTAIGRLIGLKTGQGYAIDNMGWIDLVVTVTATATTAVAGNILGRVDYIV